MLQYFRLIYSKTVQFFEQRNDKKSLRSKINYNQEHKLEYKTNNKLFNKEGYFVSDKQYKTNMLLSLLLILLFNGITFNAEAQVVTTWGGLSGTTPENNYQTSSFSAIGDGTTFVTVDITSGASTSVGGSVNAIPPTVTLTNSFNNSRATTGVSGNVYTYTFSEPVHVILSSQEHSDLIRTENIKISSTDAGALFTGSLTNGQTGHFINNNNTSEIHIGSSSSITTAGTYWTVQSNIAVTTISVEYYVTDGTEAASGEPFTVDLAPVPYIRLDDTNVTGAGGIDISVPGCSKSAEFLDNASTGATSIFSAPHGLDFMTITLTNPQDTGNETLSIKGIFPGVTVTGNATTTLTVTNVSADVNTLRNTLDDLVYVNSAIIPEITTPRTVDISVTDAFGNTSAVVTATLTLTNPPSAGATFGPLYVFTTDTTIDLFTGLDGTEDTGGTWIDNDGTGALSGSNITIATLPLGPSTFNYQVTGTGPCSNEITTVLVIKLEGSEIALTTPVASSNCGTLTTSYSNALFSANSDDPIFVFDGGANVGQLECPVGTGITTYDWYVYNPTTNSYDNYALNSTRIQTGLPDGGYLVVRNDGGTIEEGRAWVWNTSIETEAGADFSACEGDTFSLNGIAANNTDFIYYNPVERPFIVSNSTIASVTFNVTHTYISDVGYYLVSPDGLITIPLGLNETGSTCYAADNAVNLTFTNDQTIIPTLPVFDICEFARNNACSGAGPALSGTYNAYYTDPSNNSTTCTVFSPAMGVNLIDMTPLNGYNARQGGWKVQIYDCEFQDFGEIDSVIINFSDGGNTSTFSSGTIPNGTPSAQINDDSCNPAVASIYEVPFTAAVAINEALNIQDNIGVNGVGGYAWSYSTDGPTGPWSAPFEIATLTPTVTVNETTWFRLNADNGTMCMGEDIVQVTVTDLSEAGTPTDEYACAGDAILDLNTLITGGDVGGAWSVSGSSPNAPAGDFSAGAGTYNPTTGGVYIFDYTTSAIAPCIVNDIASVTISVQAAPDAGTDNTIAATTASGIIDLFTNLTGTPDTGGAWSLNGGSATPGANFDQSAGTLDSSGLSGGTYIFDYIVTSCLAATATVTINFAAPVDTDGDGVNDNVDLDDDNDGILDHLECGDPNISGATPIDISRVAILSGNASFDPVNPDTIELTPDAGSNAGTSMSNLKIDFTQDFILNYELNFGANNDNNAAGHRVNFGYGLVGGADGISVIFHNDPNGASTVGLAGAGIGASGIVNGIAIEFDTFDNTPFGGVEGNGGGNIGPDHTAIWDTDDGTNPFGGIGNPFNPIAGTSVVNLGEIEDGNFHDVEIAWNATTNTLTWSFDSVNVGTLVEDIPTTRLSGTSAFFGLSASTGSLRNRHQVTLKSFVGNLIFCDTDNDGIFDYLDLDSDGDGCPDAVEGDGTFTEASLTDATGVGLLDGGNSGMGYTGPFMNPVLTNLGNTVGTTAGVDEGVPTIAGTGQGIGGSQNDMDTTACPVDDLDGVSATIEDAGPNGGDGNGDGIPDSVQPNVGSIPTTTGSYVTMEITTNDPAQNCQQITAMAIVSESSLPNEDGSYDYPFGLVDFELTCAGNGETAQVRYYWHGITALNQFNAYRKFGPSTASGVDFDYRDDLLDINFSIVNIGGNDVLVATYLITDDAVGDDVNEGTGVINDPTGPAFLDSDGDGVYDNVDLDDDNDGILDTEECTTTVGPFTEGPNLVLNANFDDGYANWTSDFNRGRGNQSGPPDTSGGCTDQGWVAISAFESSNGTCNPYYTYSGGILDGSIVITDANQTGDNVYYAGPVIAGDQSFPLTPQQDDFCQAAYVPFTDGSSASAGNPNNTLYIDPSDVIGTSYWLQTIPNIEANATYRFKCFIYIVEQNPELAFIINGTTVFNSTVGDGSAGQIKIWQEVTFDWPSGAISGNVNIEIANTQAGCSGNDIRLDEITFAQLLADTDNDGIADCYDTDSDGDGCADAVEAAGTFTVADLVGGGDLSLGDVVGNTAGVDLGVPVLAGTGQATTTDVTLVGLDVDGDGIADACDPLIDSDNDGIEDSVDVCPGGDDTLDADNDNVPDFCDEDDDNDGILDSVENSCVLLAPLMGAANNIAVWDHRTTPATYADAQSVNATYISSAGPQLLGSGVSNTPITPQELGFGYITFDGVDQPDLASAKVDNDYLEYSFVGGPDEWVISRLFVFDAPPVPIANGEPIFNGYDITIEVSTDNFVTFTELFTDIDNPRNPAGGAGSNYFNTALNTIPNPIVVHSGTHYKVRVYFYANDALNLGQATWDNFTLAGRLCQDDNDFDNDGIENNLDLDSDNDGIYDVLEAGGTDADNGGIADGIPNTVTGIPSTAGAGLTPTDSGPTPGTPDYLDLDSDEDTCSDSNEYYGDENADDGGGQYGNGTTDPVPINTNGTVVAASYPIIGADSDSNATADYIENGPDPDADGIPNACDLDDDNDGNPDTTDSNPQDPTAEDDSATAMVGMVETIDILTNDDYLPDNTMTAGSDVYITDAGTGSGVGIITFDENTGELNYTPALSEGGMTVTIDYTVCNDLTGDGPSPDDICDTATVTITVDMGPDVDMDGIPDATDQDDDNDGILDIAEGPGDPSADDDNDGVPNYLDDDPMDPMVGDINGTVEPAYDTDGDGVSNHLDLDADNDGIYDTIETGGTDANNDGIADGTPDPITGIPSSAGTGVVTPTDTDGNVGENLPDFLDTDSDDDGCTDANEYYGNDTADGGDGGQYGTDPAAVNANGTVTGASYPATGADIDVNGTADYVDTTGDDPDADGIANACDLDDDNDGNPDTTDPNPQDPTAEDDSATAMVGMAETIDILTNDDYLPDNTMTVGSDVYITDVGTGSGVGIITFDENTGELIYTPALSEGGMVVTIDYTVCNDLTGDGPSPDDICDTATVKITVDMGPDADMDGIPDATDQDDDNDGILDIAEGPGDPSADDDNDGVPNYLDDDPMDPMVGDVNGTVEPAYDNDGDGVSNHLDLDADNDGIYDTVETGGTDANNDGIADGTPDPITGIPSSAGTGVVTPTDTDGNVGENLPDFLDTDSDDDGCTDANEYYGNDTADGGDGGQYGTDPAAVNANGTVTGASYPATGADIDGGGTTDYVDTTGDDPDADGIANACDLDDDNDGNPDTTDSNPQDPTAEDDSATAMVGMLETIDILTNDDYLPDNTMTAGSDVYITDAGTGSGVGIITFDENTGELNYTPALSEGGMTVTIDYTVCNDLTGDGPSPDDICDTATVTITVDMGPDQDMDGIPDATDQDDDNDGILDIAEGPGDPSADDDNDGVPNYLDDDPMDPMVGDINGTVEPAYDTDGDGVSNHLDLDADNDGIYDTIETGTADSDGDGIADGTINPVTGIPSSAGSGVSSPIDTDGNVGENLPDFLDTDSDDDGCSDSNEAYNDASADGGDGGQYGTDPAPVNPDGSVIAATYGNASSVADSDGNGIADYIEGSVGTPLPDPDGDGGANACDEDDDNDGNPDVTDSNPQDPTAEDDNATAIIGVPETIDILSNDDYLPDNTMTTGSDVYITDAGTGSGVGIVAFDEDTGELIYTPAGTESGMTVTIDYTVCNDLTGDGPTPDDVCDTATVIIEVSTGPDADMDSIPDVIDQDDDNDGILDIAEGPGDPSADDDNDGVPNYLDDAPLDPMIGDVNGTVEAAYDNDGDGISNHLDLDADNDGIYDVLETGGVDNNNDGIADGPIDPITGIPATAGTGIGTPIDTDGNVGENLPDFLDLDSDDDGCSDANEAYNNSNADGGDGGSYGTGEPQLGVDSNGLVIGADYTTGTNLDVTTVGVDIDGDGLIGGCDDDDDGDGELDATDPDPNDPCVYNPTNQDITMVEASWNTIDCDMDGLNNGEEITGIDDPTTTSNPNGNTTDPLDPDTDGDGVNDGQEADDMTDPNNPCNYDPTSQDLTMVEAEWNAADCDGDGVPNGQEVIDMTDPNDPCEYQASSQDVSTVTQEWLDADCDMDGLTNGEETTGVDDPDTVADPNGNTTDPQDEDTDGDGVTDGQEAIDMTDPNNVCDYDSANQDITMVEDTWSDADCDNDGLTNEEEVTGIDDPNTTGDPNGNTTDPQDIDTDGDGVTDGQEAIDMTDPNDPCNLELTSQTETPDSTWNNLDCDNDGLTNGEEITGIDDPNTTGDPNGNTTDPLDEDTDGDGVTDGQEAIDMTDPNNPCDYDAANQDITMVEDAWSDADCDNDGLTNEEEVTGIDDPNTTGDPNGNTTDPQDIDTDGDGVTDGQEAIDMTDPNNPCDLELASQTEAPDSMWLDADCDMDGLTNGEETTGIDDPDTTADPNGNTTDPLDEDTDGDGVTDGQEAIDMTDPNDVCDYDVANQDITMVEANWNAADCDGDGVTNEQEILDMTDPLDVCDYDVDNQDITQVSTEWEAADCDGDGVTNGQEVDDMTDPLEPCSFNPNSQDGSMTSSEYDMLDCDGDGVTNGDEIADGTDPLEPCDYEMLSQDVVIVTPEWEALDCDGDGVLNGTELDDGTDPQDACDFDPANQTEPVSGAFDALDCDGDGVTNGQETTDGTDPLDLCSFDITSQTETPSEEWNTSDCDGDSVTNEQEVDDETDPTEPCEFDFMSQDLSDVSDEWLALDCDGDGFDNGDELGDENDNNIPDYVEVNNGDPDSPDGINIFDIMTPNGDGLNDVFVIQGIEQYPNNSVKIYNRWGVKVYDVEGYGQNGNYFKGISEGRVTINKDDKLPVGTYYYVLEYVNTSGNTVTKAGPLYINRR